MEKFRYPQSSVCCIITGSSECGKTVIPKNSLFNIINEYEKLYIYPQSLHQGLYQDLIKSFGNYIPIKVIPNILHEVDIDIVIDEICNDEDFEKSDTEIETCESIGELKFPQEFDDGGIIILGDSNEKEMNDPRVQAIIERTRHKKLSIFVFSQNSYELPKKMIRANGNIYHIFKSSNFHDVQNLYQDKASIDMTLNDLKLLTSTCWNKNYQPLTIDTTKNKYRGRYRLRLN